MAVHSIHPVPERMRAFQNLFNRLDQVTGTKAKVQALVDHFQGVELEEACLLYTSPSPRDS